MKSYPFKFLDAYNKDDARFFFGRHEEVETLYEMIFQSQILFVYGASGTGKTSLIQCGLASKFASHDWFALTVRRGANINDNLKRTLTDAVGNTEANAGSNSLISKLTGKGTSEADTQPAGFFAKSLKAIYLQSFKPLYLIFDQFEELYLFGSNEEQRLFIESIVQILALDQPVKLIFSIREEYLGYLSDFEIAVPQLLRKKLRVEPMNRDKVKQVIVGATCNEHSVVTLKEDETIAITNGIFDKLKANEKSKTIQLPYLQVFLDKLYLAVSKDESRKSEVVFTLKELDKIGTIGDILQNFLDEQVAGISSGLVKADASLTSAAIWNILSPFATLEGTKEPIKKNDLFDKLPGLKQSSIDAVIEEFINGRILRYHEDADLYELAHDALAKRIAAKRSDEEIALLEVRRLIKSQIGLKADVRGLLSEKQINFIEPFVEKLKLSADEIQLLKDSRKAVAQYKEAEKAQLEAEKQHLLERQEHLEKDKRSQKRLIKLITAFSVVMIIVVALAINALITANNAKKVSKQAEETARINLNKATRLIDAFYFYDDKFAVAIKDFNGQKYYGFINKEGFATIDYQFAKAEQFDETSLAKVEIKDGGEEYNCLIDTTGFRYPVAYKVSEITEKTTALDLREQHLKHLPANIGDFKQLQILLLGENDLESLPPEIGKLTNLKIFDVSSNSISSLPDAFGNLTNLEQFNFDNNKFTRVPVFVTKCKKLQSIDGSANQLIRINRLAGLTALRRIKFAENAFQQVPEAIAGLTNLESIDFSYNKIKELPTTLGKLTKLSYLDVNGNLITSFPKVVVQLSNLVTLRLGSVDFPPGHIYEVPHEIKKLTKLRELDLTRTCVKDLPSELASLTRLRMLNLGACMLEKVPSVVGKMSGLKNLDLHENNLSDLPSSMSGLQNLKILNLYRNNIKALPVVISKLGNLEELDLQQNGLKSLAPEIGELKHLTYLNISDNNLSQLPDEIGQLTELQCIYLGKNRLKRIPGGISKLKHLEVLYIGDNFDLEYYVPGLKQYKSWNELINMEDRSMYNQAIRFLHTSSPNCEVR